MLINSHNAVLSPPVRSPEPSPKPLLPSMPASFVHGRRTVDPKTEFPQIKSTTFQPISMLNESAHKLKIVGSSSNSSTPTILSPSKSNGAIRDFPSSLVGNNLETRRPPSLLPPRSPASRVPLQPLSVKSSDAQSSSLSEPPRLNMSRSTGNIKKSRPSSGSRSPHVIMPQESPRTAISNTSASPPLSAVLQLSAVSDPPSSGGALELDSFRIKGKMLNIIPVPNYQYFPPSASPSVAPIPLPPPPPPLELKDPSQASPDASGVGLDYPTAAAAAAASLSVNAVRGGGGAGPNLKSPLYRRSSDTDKRFPPGRSSSEHPSSDSIAGPVRMSRSVSQPDYAAQSQSNPHPTHHLNPHSHPHGGSSSGSHSPALTPSAAASDGLTHYQVPWGFGIQKDAGIQRVKNVEVNIDSSDYHNWARAREEKSAHLHTGFADVRAQLAADSENGEAPNGRPRSGPGRRKKSPGSSRGAGQEPPFGHWNHPGILAPEYYPFPGRKFIYGYCEAPDADQCRDYWCLLHHRDGLMRPKTAGLSVELGLSSPKKDKNNKLKSPSKGKKEKEKKKGVESIMAAKKVEFQEPMESTGEEQKA